MPISPNLNPVPHIGPTQHPPHTLPPQPIGNTLSPFHTRRGPPSSSAGTFDPSFEPEVLLSRRSTVASYNYLLTARRTMDYINDGVDSVKGLYNAALGAAGTVYDAVTSKTAQRTLLKTVLFGILSTGLLGMACVAYLAFYHEYLPDQVFTVPVHLQYGYELNPYGISSLADANFKDYQAYDISVTLHLPNSPANLGRGNFMLALHLLDDNATSTAEKIMSAATKVQTTANSVPAPRSVLDGRNILYTSARPAIMPYTDPLVSLAKRILLLGYHIFVPASETTKLKVPLVERLEFRSGSPRGIMPTSLVLDVQAGQNLQVYSVFVAITARLSGLRWFMHTWWITSFLLGTSFFWFVEVFSLLITALVARLIWSVVFDGGEKSPAVKKEHEHPRIKQEGEGRGKVLEDIPMTFPTSSGQPPLRYDPPPSGHTSGVEPDAPPPDMGGEADVEDEEGVEDMEDDDPHLRDSGIGTSYSERDSGNLRRRTSRGKMSGS
ncbi:Seipin [Cytospora mali]|uniref:Seipin n=1 Tax=Cytospora mali TaxID=578113 RepID=A0A194UP25_CYTMA|nr:Seipin [Valsa mali var. pyri (nom. inval.)]